MCGLWNNKPLKLQCQRTAVVICLISCNNRLAAYRNLDMGSSCNGTLRMIADGKSSQCFDREKPKDLITLTGCLLAIDM